MEQNLLPTRDEREAINQFLKGVDVEYVALKVHEGSPWISFDVWVHLQGNCRLALWRATRAIYAVDERGAVGDDPIEEFPTGFSHTYSRFPQL